jgi:hypothetical protein
MTLPFRRRHHDAEATHDRARDLSSRGLLDDLDAEEAAWLERHLEACTECKLEHDAFIADSELLRSLREKPIEPPRDLWARTSAALDQAAAKRPLAAARSGARPQRRGWTGLSPWRGFSVGAAVGAVALLVIVVSGLIPAQLPIVIPPSGGVALGSPGPTPIDVTAQVPVLKSAPDGTLEFVFTDVGGVCPRSRPECVPPPVEHKVNVGLLGAKPSTVTLSPQSNQLVFEAEGGTASTGKIYVVPMPTTGTQSPPPPTPPVGTASPGTSAPVSPSPGSSVASPEPTPIGATEIASGVTVVGEVAYSPDGQWLAFSAAPGDGSTGPDLYLYSIGSGSATRVTDDHQTYFSAWLGSQILASRVIPNVEPAAPGNPRASTGPDESGDANGNGNGRPIEGTPGSFLLDPSTQARIDLTQGSTWLPVVDPTGRFVAYYSGNLRSTDGGVTWELATGQLVLDGWTPATFVVPVASGAAASAEPTTSAASVVGPSGHPSTLVQGNVADFRATFDPAGTKLAVWVAEHRADVVGRLYLVVIDQATGGAESTQPLAGEPSLRRFSIDSNRLAWVSPPGQDGQESSLRVLGWSGDEFGQIRTEPAPEVFIVR